MTNTLRSGESQRKKQVKFRADESLVEEFDDSIDCSRAEAFRQFMRERVGQADGDLDVPKDDADLARAYRWLVNHANENGAVPIRLARKQLAQTTSFDQDDVRRFVTEPLSRRGYVTIQDAPPGEKTKGVIRVHEQRL